MMIKPFYKSMIKSSVVEVEDFGEIDLNELPVRVHLDKEGIYEIGWVLTYLNGKEDYILSECGGRSNFDFGGRSLGVIK